jgi:protease-4
MILLSAAMVWLVGCGMPSFLVTPVSNKNELEERVVQKGEGISPAKIAIIPVEGMIANTRSESLLGSTENQVSLISQQLQAAEDDSSVKAIVLRINSPGGTVAGSDTIYDLLVRFRKKTGKPMVASAQELAASGGYYVALACDRIVAQPSSIVGSVGVVFTTFDIEGTLGKIGARTYTIKSGQFKDIGSPFKQMTPEERQLIQGMVDEYFQHFRGLVMEHRKIPAEMLPTATDGRVFTGEQALKMHLVDQVGSLEDAIDLARQLGDAKGAKAVLYVRPYGYGGSIYASNQLPPPEGKTTNINVPVLNQALPTGFYYLWEP